MNKYLNILKGGVLVSSLFVLSFTFYMEDDNSFINRIKTQLQQFNRELPVEKVYLHLDKPFYKPGEDIWFKAYLVKGMTHEPSYLSEILHVELINPKGNIEKSLKLPVTSGSTKGDFHLSESLPGGLYKIRAYTHWMKNFGDDYYFEKEIQLQKVLFPRLLMKVDFEKEAYGPGDMVSTSLSLRTLEDIPLINKEFKYIISLDGKKWQEGKGTTSSEGEAVISQELPVDLATNDGLVNFLISHENNTESISRSIPIVLNKIDLQFFPEGGDLIRNSTTGWDLKRLMNLVSLPILKVLYSIARMRKYVGFTVIIREWDLLI